MLCGCNRSLLDPLYLCIQSVLAATSLSSSWTTFFFPTIPSKYLTSSSFNVEYRGFLSNNSAIEPKHLRWTAPNVPIHPSVVSTRFLNGLKRGKRLCCPPKLLHCNPGQPPSEKPLKPVPNKRNCNKRDWAWSGRKTK